MAPFGITSCGLLCMTVLPLNAMPAMAPGGKGELQRIVGAAFLALRAKLVLTKN